MVNIIVEVSKYMIILLMTAYTFSCFSIFAQSYEEDEKRAYILQNVLMFMMQFLAYAVMYLKTEEHKLLLFFAVQVVLLVAVILLYSILYPNVSRLIVNNMCMLLSAGLIMITRLSYESAVKQFIFIALGTAFGLVVPVLIRKLKFLADWVYIYAGVGFAALLLVAVPITSPGVLLATLLCTCLAPVAGQFGWGWGLAAGFIHMTIVQNTSILHGGMNLYNNGFAAGLVCILLIPIIKAMSPEPEED